MRLPATILAALTLAAAPVDQPTRLVALPLVDLAGGGADHAALDALLAEHLAALGFDLVPADAVLGLLRRQRMRYTGGVTPAARSSMRDELGADAVFVVSLDLFETGPPPHIALDARIVTTDSGRIAWTHDVALSGDDHPGVLGRGEVLEIERLAELCALRLLEPLAETDLARAAGVGAASGVWRTPPERKRHRPRRVFRDPELAATERPLRVAVLPFDDRAVRPDAGDALAGLFATHLAGRAGLEVIEPGEVRDVLLRGRVIQEQGLSLAQADVLREMLDADLAVTGRLLDYADFAGAPVPKVAFSVWVLDVRKRTVVWSAYSANRGDDGVVFFRAGRVASARALASSMVQSAAAELARGLAAPEGR